MKSLKNVALNTGFVLTIISAFASSAFAEVEFKEKVLSDVTQKLSVELNSSTVRCIRGGYGAESLKITIPDLKYFTIFRQTTSGEVEPCINAGVCTPQSGLNVGRILDPGKPTEDVDVNIKLVEQMYIDRVGKTCTRDLLETVTAKVRGLDFSHQDQASLGTTSIEACDALAK
jgi:hypothetical protein